MSKAPSLWMLAGLLVIYNVSLILAQRGSIEAQFNVAVGGHVVLPCRTLLSTSVVWQYHWSPFESPSIVYSNYRTSDNITSHITVARTTSADYSLTINGAMANDTGLYTCIEDGGNGDKHTFSLLVDEARQGSIEAQFHVAVGGRVVLPCRTTPSSSVDWRYHWSFIYSNCRIYNNIPSRFKVEHNTNGDYNLTINDAVVNDTGIYTCIEDEGLDAKHIFSVLVDEAGPPEFGSTTPKTGASSNGAVAALTVTTTVIVVIVLIILIVVIVVIVIWLKRRNKTKNGKTTGEIHQQGSRDNEIELENCSRPAVTSAPADVEEEHQGLLNDKVRGKEVENGSRDSLQRRESEVPGTSTPPRPEDNNNPRTQGKSEPQQ